MYACGVGGSGVCDRVIAGQSYNNPMMLFSPENVCMHVKLGGVEYVIESSRDILRTIP